MRILAIVNPAANSGRNQDIVVNLESAAALHADFSLDIIQTTTRDESFTLIEKSVHGFGARGGPIDAVIAVGGDGTVHGVVNGLMRSGAQIPLAVLPVGTGNDFAETVQSPKSAEELLGVIENDDPTWIDIGRVITDSSESFFCNSLGVGFDALVSHRSSRWKKFFGVLGYRLAVGHGIALWRKTHFSITTTTECVVGDHLFVSIHNGPCSGGGIALAPAAQIADGFFDIVQVSHAGPVRILRVLPAALKGRHLAAPEVTVVKDTKIDIEILGGTWVHADGESLGTSISSISIEVIPKALPVFTQFSNAR